MAAVTAAAASVARTLAAAVDPTRLRSRVQHARTTTVVYALALTLAAVALAFALLAAHAGLRLVVPAWTASLIVCVALALGAWLFARRRAPGRRTSAPLPLSAPVEQQAIGNMAATLAAAAAFVPLLDVALMRRARPVETMLTALAAGVVAGSLRRGLAR